MHTWEQYSVGTYPDLCEEIYDNRNILPMFEYLIEKRCWRGGVVEDDRAVKQMKIILHPGRLGLSLIHI